MIRGYPCDFHIVMCGRKGHTSVHGHLDRPVPVHLVTVTGDGDVCRPTAVHTAIAAGDRDGARLEGGDQPVSGNKDVVRVHPETRSGGGHLNFVDVDLQLESTACSA